MNDADFTELITTQARVTLEDNHAFIAHLVSKGQKFENWLQMEIFKALLQDFPSMEIEKTLPSSAKRCDFWIKAGKGRENWLELKLCVTNYCTEFKDNASTRPITSQIAQLIQDAERLRQLPSSYSRSVLLIAYPLPDTEEEHPMWTGHLQNVESRVKTLHRAFSLPMTRNGRIARVSGYVLAV